MKAPKRLSSFAAACKVEKLDPKKLIIKLPGSSKDYVDALIAIAQLFIIIKAANRLANDGKEWKPNWDDSSQYKYYPWFWMDGGSSGFRFVGYDGWISASGVGSRLCFKSREDAEYYGKKFLPLYKKFMVIE